MRKNYIFIQGEKGVIFSPPSNAYFFMTYHYSVLKGEVIRFLQPQKNENFIDATLGDGGHTEAILQKNGPDGKVLAIDLDPEAIKKAKKRLAKYGDRIIFAESNFKNLKEIIYDNGFSTINGIVLDLGFSRGELQDKRRGFSFLADAPLDMRFGREGGPKASDIVNEYEENKLKEIFKNYGEERYAGRISRAIVEYRKSKKIKSTGELVDIIKKAVPKSYLHQKIHPATRVFQALRIEVNEELENLKEVLPQAVEVLQSRGRLVVISFHSLEDRIVKKFFKIESTACICPKEVPICKCGHEPSIQILTKKPITPSEEEIMENPPSRSAKLRVAQKI